MEMKLHYVVREIRHPRYEYIAGPFSYEECWEYIYELNTRGDWSLMKIMSHIEYNCDLET